MEAVTPTVHAKKPIPEFCTNWWGIPLRLPWWQLWWTGKGVRKQLVKYSCKKQKHKKQTNKKPGTVRSWRIRNIKRNVWRIRGNNSSMNCSFLPPPLHSCQCMWFFKRYWKSIKVRYKKQKAVDSHEEFHKCWHL